MSRPRARQHDIDNPHCWCNPRYERVCPKCLGVKRPCINCDGLGFVPCAPEDAEIVIHEGEKQE